MAVQLFDGYTNNTQRERHLAVLGILYYSIICPGLVNSTTSLPGMFTSLSISWQSCEPSLPCLACRRLGTAIASLSALILGYKQVTCNVYIADASFTEYVCIHVASRELARGRYHHGGSDSDLGEMSKATFALPVHDFDLSTCATVAWSRRRALEMLSSAKIKTKPAGDELLSTWWAC